MRNNILFDTSCGSLNMGDYIICESVERELKDILQNDFLVKIASHTPVTHFYQNSKINPLFNYCKNADYKFFAGTNMLQFHLFMRPWANFNANLFNCAPYKNTILVGAGSDKNKAKMDLYTKILFRKVLSRNYVHSVRDESTKKTLESLGLKAINTGCATMWCLTAEHCKKIPTNKHKNVVFTLTDYRKDPKHDEKFINLLRKNYDELYFWIQGTGDYEYINILTDTKDIHFIAPSLNAYREALQKIDDIDYVGTRLHAGIFAMQNFVRSIIIVVDNRTRDMKETYNIVAVDRNNLQELDKMINSSFETEIKINEDRIAEWKAQFREENKK